MFWLKTEEGRLTGRQVGWQAAGKCQEFGRHEVKPSLETTGRPGWHDGRQKEADGSDACIEVDWHTVLLALNK